MMKVINTHIPLKTVLMCSYSADRMVDWELEEWAGGQMYRIVGTWNGRLGK